MTKFYFSKLVDEENQ